MLANTIKRMDEEGQSVAALITGGYHTKGLTQLLKQRQTSYLVILPKFDSSKGERPYVAILTNKKEPYENLLKSGQYYIAAGAFLGTIRNLADPAKIEEAKNQYGTAFLSVLLSLADGDKGRCEDALNRWVASYENIRKNEPGLENAPTPEEVRGFLASIVRDKLGIDIPTKTAIVSQSPQPTNIYSVDPKEITETWYHGFIKPHVKRVTAINMKIGEELKLPPEQMRLLQYASLLHDVGADIRGRHEEMFIDLSNRIKTAIKAKRPDIRKISIKKAVDLLIADGRMRGLKGDTDYDIFVRALRELLNNRELSDVEKEVARSIFDVPTKSLEILKEKGIELPKDLEILIRYNNDYKAFLKDLPSFEKEISIPKEDMARLISILYCGEIFEHGNNRYTMVKQREEGDIETFPATMGYMEKTIADEKLSREPIDAIISLIVNSLFTDVDKQDRELIEIIGHARDAESPETTFRAEDINFALDKRYEAMGDFPEHLDINAIKKAREQFEFKDGKWDYRRGDGMTLVLGWPLENAITENISGIMKALREIEPDPEKLYFYDPKELHITIASLIPNTNTPTAPQDNDYRMEKLNRARGIASGFDTIRAKFYYKDLVLTDRGEIVALGYVADNNLFNMRDKLRGEKVSCRYTDVVHMTIGRIFDEDINSKPEKLARYQALISQLKERKNEYAKPLLLGGVTANDVKVWNQLGLTKELKYGGAYPAIPLQASQSLADSPEIVDLITKRVLDDLVRGIREELRRPDAGDVEDVCMKVLWEKRDEFIQTHCKSLGVDDEAEIDKIKQTVAGSMKGNVITYGLFCQRMVDDKIFIDRDYPEGVKKVVEKVREYIETKTKNYDIGTIYGLFEEYSWNDRYADKRMPQEFSFADKFDLINNSLATYPKELRVLNTAFKENIVSDEYISDWVKRVAPMVLNAYVIAAALNWDEETAKRAAANAFEEKKKKVLASFREMLSSQPKKPIFVCDLDGTVTEPNKPISEKNIKIVIDILKKGIPFVILSGISKRRIDGQFLKPIAAYLAKIDTDKIEIGEMELEELLKLIPPDDRSLLKNLFIASDNGTQIYVYDAKKNGFVCSVATDIRVFIENLEYKEVLNILKQCIDESKCRDGRSAKELIREVRKDVTDEDWESFKYNEESDRKIIDERKVTTEDGKEVITQITLMMVGKDATSGQKDLFNTEDGQSVREDCWKRVKEAFAKKGIELEARISGKSSIDITPEGIDKGDGVLRISLDKTFPKGVVIFVGDAFFPGGNDEPAIKAVDYIVNVGKHINKKKSAYYHEELEVFELPWTGPEGFWVFANAYLNSAPRFVEDLIEYFKNENLATILLKGGIAGTDAEKGLAGILQEDYDIVYRSKEPISSKPDVVLSRWGLTGPMRSIEKLPPLGVGIGKVLEYLARKDGKALNAWIEENKNKYRAEGNAGILDVLQELEDSITYLSKLPRKYIIKRKEGVSRQMILTRHGITSDELLDEKKTSEQDFVKAVLVGATNSKEAHQSSLRFHVFDKILTAEQKEKPYIFNGVHCATDAELHGEFAILDPAFLKEMIQEIEFFKEHSKSLTEVEGELDEAEKRIVMLQRDISQLKSYIAAEYGSDENKAKEVIARSPKIKELDAEIKKAQEEIDMLRVMLLSK
ncbi:MAG: HAD hydrolase family protein, partial [Candidatus Omnitrophica bacterium]|nr:HAD hydrolase family protein [Candidatus Omnitrophota bacterium]